MIKSGCDRRQVRAGVGKEGGCELEKEGSSQPLCEPWTYRGDAWTVIIKGAEYCQHDVELRIRWGGQTYHDGDESPGGGWEPLRADRDVARFTSRGDTVAAESASLLLRFEAGRVLEGST